jgi:hypothetical protein
MNYRIQIRQYLVMILGTLVSDNYIRDIRFLKLLLGTSVSDNITMLWTLTHVYLDDLNWNTAM